MPPAKIDDDILSLLQCPVSGQVLRQRDDGALATPDGARIYAVSDDSILCLGDGVLSNDALSQQHQYDAKADLYARNLSYPHTQSYTTYLNDAFLKMIPAEGLQTVAEICCGQGEAARLLSGKFRHILGVDVSMAMLRRGRARFGSECTFIQGDASCLPLRNNCVDAVVMIGGIHHVNDRVSLFREVARILKPGGRFYWREPLSDFFLWRWMRAVIYRLSPFLDHKTERPLRWHESVPFMTAAGLSVETWRPIGFLGFCLFMNSHVLVVNRLFRFIPGITRIVRAFIALDEFLLKGPRARSLGLMVVGRARKSLSSH